MKLTFVLIRGTERYERELNYYNYARTSISRIFLTPNQIESDQYIAAAKLVRVENRCAAPKD